MEKNKIIIKNCPFCGESAKIESATFGDSIIKYYRVDCENGHSLDWWGDTPEEAIYLWNQRI